MLKILTVPYKIIFYYPGRILLWYRYFFPQKQKRGNAFLSVAESRRQYKEGGYLVAFIASCGFWGGAFLVFFYILSMRAGA